VTPLLGTEPHINIILSIAYCD